VLVSTAQAKAALGVAGCLGSMLHTLPGCKQTLTMTYPRCPPHPRLWMQVEMLQHSQGDAEAQAAIHSELVQRASQRASQNECEDPRWGAP
jgi:hypothetical protein